MVLLWLRRCGCILDNLLWLRLCVDRLLTRNVSVGLRTALIDSSSPSLPCHPYHHPAKHHQPDLPGSSRSPLPLQSRRPVLLIPRPGGLDVDRALAPVWLEEVGPVAGKVYGVSPWRMSRYKSVPRLKMLLIGMSSTKPQVFFLAVLGDVLHLWSFLLHSTHFLSVHRQVATSTQSFLDSVSSRRQGRALSYLVCPWRGQLQSCASLSSEDLESRLTWSWSRGRAFCS